MTNVLHEVKEYAARANEINVDTLQMKLMHLDEMGRRFDHVTRNCTRWSFNVFCVIKISLG